MSDNEEDGPRLQDEADVGNTRPVRATKLTENGKSFKLEQYYGMFRKLKTSVTRIKKLMLENKSDTEDVRKQYSTWLQTYGHFLDLFDELKSQIDDKTEKDKMCADHFDYDIFLVNFKKEVEDYFSGMEEIRSKSSKAKSRRGSGTSYASSISSQRIKEETKVAELEARKAALFKKKKLEMAKLQLKLEEELDIDTGIAVSHAKTEVLQKYENISQTDEQSLKQHNSEIHDDRVSSPRQSIPKPSPKTLFQFPQEFGSQISYPLDPNATVFEPKPPCVMENRDNALKDVVQYLRRPLPEIKKFGGDPLEYRRFIRQFNAKVVVNTQDDDERMNYLEQMTYGEANRVVSGFSHMDGEKAYKTAMKQLEERYGDNETIVTAFIKKALDWPQVKDSKMLDEFSLFLVECKHAAESMNSIKILDYQENIKKLMIKLPIYMHDRWRSVVVKTKENKKSVIFSDFVRFVQNEAKKSNDPTYGTMSVFGTQQIGNKSNKRTVTATDVLKDTVNSTCVDTSVKCVYCKNSSHSLSDCKSFIGISLSQRYDFLRNNGLCFGCFKKGHITKKCRSRLSCTICKRKHPTILHDETRIRSVERIEKPTTDQQIACSSVSLHTDTGAGLEDWDDVSCAMAIIPVRVKRKDSPHSVVTYAFFDSGSSVSFCTKNIMDHLGVSGKRCHLTLSTMGTPYEMTAHALSDLQLCDLSMTQFVNLPRVYTKDKMPVNKDHIPTQAEIKKWIHLAQVEVPDIDTEIGLLIGNNVPDAYAPLEVLTGPSGSPHATKTKLGWIVWNLLRNRGTHEVNRVSIESCVDRDEKLEELVKKSMDMDFPERTIDNRRENSVEDEDFLTQVKQSIRLHDHHYSVALPFRKTAVKMPDNSSQAYQRLKGLKKKLERDVKFRENYVDFMSKLFEKNYAEMVPKDKLERNDGRVWYIPHHGVYHSKKPEKIRVVFDCSATFMGSCLNKELLQGPDLTNNLLGVLLRFRQDHIAVQGDIEAMFYQVFVPEADRDFLRFLWWENGNLDSEPKIFRMKVHIFGATSSPSCCNYTLQHLATENKQNYKPSVITAIQRSMYVDDCLSSLSTEEEAKSFVKDISSLCQSGGFHLTKWISNSVAVLETIPEEDCAKNVKEWIIGEKCSAERALGVQWFIETDQLGFQISIKKQPATRRGILSTVSSVYDPLGLASPFVMSAKILLQTLCRLGVQWDEEISEEHMKCWTKWISQAQQLEALKIERCYKPKEFGRVVSCQLHCFSDASDVGMGEVIYLRFVNEQGKIHCTFVIGKSRLAPLKTITIPRKELTAAVVMVKLAMVVSNNLDLAIDHVFYWTDSMTVLKYIANTSARFHTFVANRLAVIREATNFNQWCYVSSKDNPADCASRGIGRIDKFLSHTLWFNGPGFLWKDQHEWPKQDLHDVKEQKLTDDPEVKRDVTLTLSIQKTENNNIHVNGVQNLLNCFSDWNKLKKITAWILHAKNNLRKLMNATQTLRQSMKNAGESSEKIEDDMQTERKKRLLVDRVIPELTPADIKHAEEALIAFVQRQAFSEEIHDLCCGEEKRVKKSSKLAKLDPIFDNGLLKVGGRLGKSDLSFEVKHPVIIPKTSKLSRLIMDDAHRSTGHLGKNSTLAVVRQRFWILGASDLFKSIASKCVICRKYQSPILKQKMSDLPKERLQPDNPPFSSVGMDYFGPFELKRGRSTVKRYGVIFTCMVTRAVHLEMAFSLDTDSCISAIRRFIARRGKPNVIRSDNGTNLTGAEKELREAIQAWNSHKIHDHLLQKGIQWEFNPPAASHFGGFWERLIRSVRKILYSIMQEQVIRLDDEGLQTLFSEVEAVLNGRPLVESPSSTNDLEVLTPNHLLLLRPGEQFPPGTFLKTDIYVKRRWRQIQYLADIFWTRWMKEYLPLLQKRQKWLKPVRNLQIDDLVLIVENTPRNNWNLGRIVEVQPDSNGIVRVVKVKTASTTLIRPISKLCLVLESDIKQ